jgi:lysophospholipase L1-like esterase
MHFLTSHKSVALVAASLLAITTSFGLANTASAADLSAVAIGDSVMLGAKSQLQRIGVSVVDAKVSRQASVGPELVRKLAKNPNIKHVVIHLGTNGFYSVDSCRETIRAAGLKRTVFLVNLKVPRKWEKTNNSLMRKCAAGFSSSRVQVLDWYSISQTKSAYLYSDGIHLTPAGAKKFAGMIRAAIKQTITWQDRVTPGPR